MALTREFDAPVVRETAYGVVEDFGVKHNKMTLVPLKSTLMIEWEVEEVEEYVEIGIDVEGDKKVTGYDGVFELPKEAIALLKENGYDTKEVE